MDGARATPVQELRSRVRAARQELSQTVVGRAPTVPELARHAGMSEEEVRAALEALESYSALSLDAEVQGSDDGYTLADTIGGPDPALDTVIDREAVRPRLSRLPERDRRILYLRFFRDMTQSGIAADLGLSQMHVSRLISRCCAGLRDEVMRDSVQPGRRDGASRRRRPSYARPARTRGRSPVTRS